MDKHNFIRLRRGTALEWTNSQPQPDGEVLKLGEPGYEKDTRKLKIGDGVTGWNNLPYFIGSMEEIEDIIGNNFFVAGSGISLNYDDNNDQLIISSTITADTGDITFSGSTISTKNTDQNMTITTNGSGDIYIGADRNMIFDMNGFSAKGILLQDSQEDGYDDPNSPSTLKVGSIYHDTGKMVVKSDGSITSQGQPAAYFLYHFDNNYDDSSTNNITTTNYGSVLSDAQSKFGNYSLYLDGNSSGGRLYIDDSSSSLGTNDFTLGLWINLTEFHPENGIVPIIGKLLQVDSYDWLLCIDTNGVLNFKIPGFQAVGSTSVSLYSWHYISITRSGNVFKLFLDGNEEASFSSIDSIGNTRSLVVGAEDYDPSTNNFIGYIDDLFMVMGTSLYNTNFTIPTQPYGLGPSTSQVYGGLWLTNGENTGLSIPGPSGSINSGSVSILNNGVKWEFNSTNNSIILDNTSSLAQGTYDNNTGGNNGISLNCTVGYELNWQGGHLKSTSNNGNATENIQCDSPIEFPGSGINNVKIDNSGLTFSDNSTQITSATNIVNDSFNTVLVAGSGINLNYNNNTLTIETSAPIQTVKKFWWL